MANAFTAKLEGHPESSATFVRVPAAVMKTFGGRVRVPVRATVNGVTWRTTIADMGGGPMIGLTAKIRDEARVKRGDTVTVSIEVDAEERTVTVPDDLAKAMGKTRRRVFDAMSYTHRKEYVQWVEGAKKPETRMRRIEKVCIAMSDKKSRV